jgi:hypothetical protein
MKRIKKGDEKMNLYRIITHKDCIYLFTNRDNYRYDTVFFVPEKLLSKEKLKKACLENANFHILNSVAVPNGYVGGTLMVSTYNKDHD